MKLSEWLDKALWSVAKLAKEAKISENSARRAVSGEKVTRLTAEKITVALSRKLGKALDGEQIDGLNIASIKRRKKPASATTPPPTSQTPKKPKEQQA